jgi:hypothetical protein
VSRIDRLRDFPPQSKVERRLLQDHRLEGNQCHGYASSIPFRSSTAECEGYFENVVSARNPPYPLRTYISIGQTNCNIRSGKDHLGDIGDDHYYAGIWSTHLLCGLTWKVTRSPDTSAQYVAPSWSWASVNGVVDYPTESLGEPGAEVLDICTVPKGNDSFGQLIGGCLRLKGLLCEFEVRAMSLYLKGSKMPFPWFWSDSVRHNDLSRLRSRLGLTTTKSLFGMVLEQSAEEHSVVEGQPYRQVRGILLKPTNLQRGQYRRCGMFGTHHAGPQPTLQGIMSKLYKSLVAASRSRSIGNYFYEDFDGVNCYTISVI